MKHSTQYTVRQVPPNVDRSLRQKSKHSRQSLNETIIQALTMGLGLTEEPPRFHDLDAVAGSWQEDKAFDAALAAQDQVDPKLWK